MKHLFAKLYVWLLLAILYAPILIIIIFSFTEARVLGNWTGFSTKLYQSLFSGGVNNSLFVTLLNTFAIAFIAASASAVLGSLAAIGIFNLRHKTRNTVLFLNNIPILNPEIITGVSLFLLFVSLGISQGFMTVVLAHISFCVPYVVLSILPRLKQMNPSLYEAALDLGATPMQALRKVIFPEIKPGIISGFILTFTLSFDDFVVSLFTIGNEGLQTLSTYIYADARKGGLTPELRPLTSLILLSYLFCFSLSTREQRNPLSMKIRAFSAFGPSPCLSCWALCRAIFIPINACPRSKYTIGGITLMKVCWKISRCGIRSRPERISVSFTRFSTSMKSC